MDFSNFSVENFELCRKSVNIWALAQWILEQIPVLETPLDSTRIFKTLNDDWMSKSLPKKPPKSREDENVKTWLRKGLAKN